MFLTSSTRSLVNCLPAIRKHIAFYEAEVERHPLAAMIRSRTLSACGERAFALYLFMDSWMWPPMLISMRDHVTNTKLKHAIEDNLQDEAGKRGVSHIKMCIDFLKSLRYVPALVNIMEINRTINITCGLTEAQIAGWLAAAEILTLPLYRIAKECFQQKPDVDLRYLNCHMKVDEDHIAWLWSAVEAILDQSENPQNEVEIYAGIALGARATLKSMDEIYEEALASH
jgi:hypothetical protein